MQNINADVAVRRNTGGLGGISVVSIILLIAVLSGNFIFFVAHNGKSLTQRKIDAVASITFHSKDQCENVISATIISPQLLQSDLRLIENVSKDFSYEKSVLFARLSSVSYCSFESEIKDWNCSRCKHVPNFAPYKVVNDSRWDVLGFVGYHKDLDAIIITFRGTDSSNLGNWIHNFQFFPMNESYPVPGSCMARVHTGFHSIWMSSKLGPSIKQAVGELLGMYPEAALYVTGHSMGAAVAQLSALDLKFLYNISKVHVYTFGSPRVGDLDFAKLLNATVTEHWRFTHNRDAVPSVPPECWGYHHAPNEVWEVDTVELPKLKECSNPGARNGTEYCICDNSGEDPHCHNHACSFGLCNSIPDHLLYLGIRMSHDRLEC